ncbi:hypothetical protein BD410DRAFT_903237 [Rickenella mellea]|uniref:F-box domain-containing protein n=1 Tax=Rickenella mellea TaxID=50990 RepID=A0A4Y7PEG0_9AGAM|nr:hypothetical protein BD410DRAFT_903237 [Rickenella mellea]
MDSQVVALTVWMKRATPLLLSVHLRYPTLPVLCISEFFQLKKLPAVFNGIVKHAGRWRDAKLSLPAIYLAVAWSLTQQNASHLETVDINDTSITMLGPVDLAGPMILRADTADTLSELSVRASLSCAAKVAPFVRLRTLSLEHSLPENCLILLKFCPVLEDLTLHFHDIHNITLTFDHPILLSRLRNFHLSHTGNSADGNSSLSAGSEVGLVLDSLELPNLKGFYLWTTIVGLDRYSDPELPWDYLFRLIIRSNCSLNELELRAAYMENSSIMKCVEISPYLKYVGIPWDEELEDEVRQSLPSLQSLRMFEGLAR